MTTHAMEGPATPWYRDRWPWFLIAGPAIVVVAAMVTLWLAIASDDGLVADDYYKRGLLINKTLERQGRGEALQIGADVMIDIDGAVRVELRGAGDTTASPATVRLRLVHPTRAGQDAAVELPRGRDGSYNGRAPSLAAGRWRVSVETDAWRLPSVESAVPGETRLGSERMPH
jgi:hypothetical protein